MRVLELSGGVATSYAAKLLADEGADVIKVEPLTGDSLRASWGSASQKRKPENGFLFSGLNVNKRGVAIDYEDKAALSRLLNWADLVVLGGYYGSGKKGGKISTHLMGCKDAESGRWKTVCKVGNGFTDEPSMLQGLGRNHFIVDHAEGDALHFDCGEIGISTGNAMTARDFGLLSAVAGSPHGALTLTASGGTGSVYRTFDITNVHTSATDHDRGFRTGIRLVNQRHGVVRGCIHNGVRNVVPGERQGSAIVAEGDGESHPVDFTIENCQAYFAGCGVHLIGTHEGITIDKHSAVACDEGVLVEADEYPLDGGNAGKPLFWITNCHFQTFRTGMRLMRARDFIVTGNDLLVEQPDTSWTGLVAEVGDAASQYGWIDGNKFQDATRVGRSAGRTTGIALNGTPEGVLDTRIGVNRYVNLVVGLHLGADARRVVYSDASLYAAVDTPIIDEGSGNSRY